MECGDLPLSGKVGIRIMKLPYIFDNLKPGIYRAQMFLEDPEWKKNWIILNKKITLYNAETTIIDKSDFIYRKYWALCFIPAVAQFYNFEPVQGSILLALTGISLIESVITGYSAWNHYSNVYLPAKRNSLEDINSTEFSRIIGTPNLLTISFLSGIGLFGVIYIYLCIDGLVAMMKHLYNLFYPHR